MSDILEILREYKEYAETKSEREAFDAVIDEIIRFRTENEKLREALKDCEKEMRSIVSYIRIAPNTKWDRDSGILLEVLRKADAARAALEGVTEPASPWRDIESAPRDGTKILALARSHTDYYGVAEWAEANPDFQRSVAGWFWAFAIRPTHWMPLPEPPR